jgi:hypothetical protein
MNMTFFYRGFRLFLSVAMQFDGVLPHVSSAARLVVPGHLGLTLPCRSLT